MPTDHEQSKGYRQQHMKGMGKVFGDMKGMGKVFGDLQQKGKGKNSPQDKGKMNGKGQAPASRMTQKGVPPPPPPIMPKSQGGRSFHEGPDGKKEDWKERLERLAEEAKPQYKIKLKPPLESDWVQCCHGGIEPRFDPRPLLQSHKRFCVTGVGPDFDRGREFEGLNWSDFTGIDHKSQDRFSSKDPRGGHSGFDCDIPDVRFYSENVGIKAFFRGHQDTLCCFKLVVRHQEGVVPWPKLLTRAYSGNVLYRLLSVIFTPGWRVYVTILGRPRHSACFYVQQLR